VGSKEWAINRFKQIQQDRDNADNALYLLRRAASILWDIVKRKRPFRKPEPAPETTRPTTCGAITGNYTHKCTVCGVLQFLRVVPDGDITCPVCGNLQNLRATKTPIANAPKDAAWGLPMNSLHPSALCLADLTLHPLNPGCPPQTVNPCQIKSDPDIKSDPYKVVAVSLDDFKKILKSDRALRWSSVCAEIEDLGYRTIVWEEQNVIVTIAIPR
jgi:hypothetical protein